MSMGNAPDEHSKEMDLAEGILEDDDPYAAGPEEYGMDDEDDDLGLEEDEDGFGEHGTMDDLGEEYR
jgi:hypothetical protein